jgi:aconitate hydratase
MVIIPLQYMEGESASTLQLTGCELFSIDIPQDLQSGQVVNVQGNDSRQFEAKVRFGTMWR